MKIKGCELNVFAFPSFEILTDTVFLSFNFLLKKNNINNIEGLRQGMLMYMSGLEINARKLAKCE